MAKQTINIGASPNDGTGTPLRTAFDYTNQNFTELYTATGPSGNNIVVPGSATITGDLTVDTSTLKVDSANNRVGIGTASPNNPLTVNGTIAAWNKNAYILYSDSGSTYIGGLGNGGSIFGSGTDNDIGITTGGATNLRLGTNNTERYRIASDGVATWSNVGGVAGTRMTLNATGLGVGAVPSGNNQFTVRSSGAGTEMTVSLGRALAEGIIGIAAGTNGFVNGSVAGDMVVRSIGKLMLFNNDANAGITIDTSANVGIGVTPSAWTTSYNALNIGSGGSIAAYKSANYDQLYVGSNFFENTSGAWRFINNGYATQYWHNSGSHVWRISTTSNAAGANQPLTWTQAMTLDASGNLLIGKTSSANSVAGVNIYKDATDGGRVYLTRQSGSASQTNVAFFESGGSAVGSISTTNTATSYNISSDYRLKQEVQPLVGGLARISALKPSIYKWKIDGSSSEGFLAHELAEAVPLAVTGEKDAVNEDGSIKPQAVDLSKVVPVLVAAIQELTARVQTLETR